MIELVGGMLTQWDSDRSVEIANALSVDEVHFANEGDSVAVKMPVTEVDGKKTAAIPKYLLQSGKSVRAYGVNGGVTVKVISFPVRKRERPVDYVYEDDQRNYIYRLISDAQDATANARAVAEEIYNAKENGEFKGEKGDKGDKGDPGNPPEPMIITLNPSMAKASESSGAIRSQIVSGGSAYVEYLGEYYPIQIYDSAGMVCFTLCEDDFYNLVKYVIDEEGWYSAVSWATYADANQIGDISSALDEIREYAENLINGGGYV